MSQPFNQCSLPMCFLHSYTATVDWTSSAEAMHRAISNRVPDLLPLPELPTPIYSHVESAACRGGCAGGSLARISAKVVESDDAMNKKQHGVFTSLSSAPGDEFNTIHIAKCRFTVHHRLGTALAKLLPAQQPLHLGTIRPNIVPIPVFWSEPSPAISMPVRSAGIVEDTNVAVSNMEYGSLLSHSVHGSFGAGRSPRSAASAPKMLQPHEVLSRVLENIMSNHRTQNQLWPCAFVPEPLLTDPGLMPPRQAHNPRHSNTQAVKALFTQQASHTGICCLQNPMQHAQQGSFKMLEKGKHFVHIELIARQPYASLDAPSKAACYVDCVLTLFPEYKAPDLCPRGKIPICVTGPHAAAC